MTVEEITGHLANLVILIEYHERFGGTQNKWVLKEFNSLNEIFLKALKEKHGETG